MATPNVGILTTAGKALIDKVNSGQAKISFSKIVFSSMDNSKLSDMQVKALTAIAPQEVVVSSPETTLDTNSGETRIRATGTNEKLADGVYVKTYGVFAKDDTGREILYGVTVSPNPNYFPAYDGVTPQAVTYSYKTVIQETSNITMTNSNDVYASQEDLTEAIQPYAKTIDVNQQLDKKVVDNKNGTEQLNGVQVQPFNKLSDTIGGRNLLLGTSNQVVQADNWNMKVADIKYDKSLGGTLCASVMINNADHTSNLLRGLAQLNLQTLDKSGKILAKASGNSVAYNANGLSWCSISIDDNTSDVQAYIWTNNMNQNAFYSCLKIERGSVATDWTPAPDDKADDSKVVHSTDMRKPASDVAGLEDVSTSVYQSKLENGTDIHTVTKNGIYPLGYSYINFIDSKYHWGTLQVINNSAVIVHIARLESTIWVESYSGAPGLWHPWHKLSFDDEVAHLSGANNFDTVPTVKNNPLLLASSLPSDLARTGSNQEFTGKNTFDTAPIDKTTGNPYITKDGVPSIPSDVARTSQQTNFTAGLQTIGFDVLGVKVFSDTDDYKTFAAAHPSVITIVTHNTSTN